VKKQLLALGGYFILPHPVYRHSDIPAVFDAVGLVTARASGL